MPATPTYLLDTNILLAFIRGGPLGEHCDSTYELRASPYKPLICVVSVGEILSLSKLFGWGQKKLDLMEKLLGELVQVDISSPDILDAYAEIDHTSRMQGRPMGKNDVWIAATAEATGATLLTTDTDFDHLSARINLTWVDPAHGKP